MLAVIIGGFAVVILLAICVFLIMIPYNQDPVLKSADPQVIKRIPGPRSLPYLGDVLVFNVPRESKFSSLSDRGRGTHSIVCSHFSAVQFVLVK
jgi:hypothetical protein